MTDTTSYHTDFIQMFIMMANDLNVYRKKEAKTMIVNRILLHQLIDFMAVYQNVKDSDVAEDVGISNRTLYSIKNESRTDSPDYTSIRTSTIDNVIQYTYILAEIIEQKDDINVELK